MVSKDKYFNLVSSNTKIMFKYFFTFFLFLTMENTVLAQNQYFYEGFYVNFSSECCGVNQDGLKKLEALEKKYAQYFQKATIRWGREGERLFLYTSKELKSAKFQELVKQIHQDIRLKYKLVDVKTLFEYETKKSTFWVHIPPFGINEANEAKWLEYVKTFEKDNKIELLKGSMINETHDEQDQDKRYELYLNKLSEEKRKDFILQSQKILTQEQ